ncbi:asparagine synthase (glutamine-hydrolyzing) [Ferroacidibacillus organovorans]|uniref:asparagine synthase (glutamine-hydrolyzing) n=1 Tax=Ferroacidibacillus organovorans TaxID=1765683 RepID=A0A101XS73_9BACL|nr:asparagine synthase (glutamine-hydrolyzing) [Ferroacidibacillus organovorans]KUO96563.1 hypothetical protein ATW55_00310 [Ferroacidibacillus organovorans]
MCGIAAIVPKIHSFSREKELLVGMLESMAHRGPDGHGVMQRGCLALGMVRLAIVDLEHGMQPLFNEDETLALVCNGEIYNADNLRASLIEAGHVFQTKSDSEVILHLYEEKGKECLAELEGIFAFALWSEKEQTLFIARDRLGVKPLYYMDQGTYWAIASEMRALLPFVDEEVHLDGDALTAYHTYRFTPREKTMVKGIYRLLPGHYAVISNTVMACQPYWIPVFASSRVKGSTVNQAEHLRSLLFDAVKSQHAEEVNSAVLLSGGLDSTAILAMRREFLGDREDCAITVAFERPKRYADREEYTEMEEAERVALRFGAHHLAQTISAEEALDAFPRIIQDLDEPIADPTAIPLWFAARLANRHDVKVLYSGEGMDELFAGYSIYGHEKVLRRMRMVPSPLRRALRNTLLRADLPGTGVLERSLSDVETWYQGVGGVFTRAERNELLGGDESRCARYPSAFYGESLDEAKHSAGSDLQRMMLLDLVTWLPDNTLAKSDKITMAHSVEMRVPFLNQNVVDYALACPDHLKWKREGKEIVRRALTGVIPEEVLRRKKVGFNVPVSAWIFGEWNSYAKAMLLSDDAVTRMLYEHRATHLFDAKSSQQERAGRLLFAMLTLELWLRRLPTRADKGRLFHEREVAHYPAERRIPRVDAASGGKSDQAVAASRRAWV